MSAATIDQPSTTTSGTSRRGTRTTVRNPRKVATTTVWYVVTSLCALLALAPLYVMVTTGFKSEEDLTAFPPTLVPDQWLWGNYWQALTSNDFLLQLGNSLIYAGGSTVANVVFSGLAGYALARLRFPGRNVIFFCVVGLLMVPAQSQIVPVFIVLQHIPLAGGNNILGQGGSGLLNTYAGLILPSAATPMGIFLMRQFFSSIPEEYAEAARIDGAGPLRILVHVMAPLCKPAVATLAILSFQSAWNEFVWPLVLTTDTSMATLQLGLQLYQTGQDAETNLLMAASTLTVIPMIVLFIVAQRHFVGGLSAGLKG